MPLGASPANGSLGYPLVRGFITRTELRAVIELTLAQGAANSDYDLGLAGIKFEYDKTRPALTGSGDLLDATKGQVTKISLDTDHSDGFEQYDDIIYQNGTSSQFDSTLVSIVASSYIAQFAGDAGVTLKTNIGAALAIPDAILKHTDGTEVKQVEAFMRSIHNAPGSKVPSTYDPTSPSFTTRQVCTKGC